MRASRIKWPGGLSSGISQVGDGSLGLGGGHYAAEADRQGVFNPAADATGINRHNGTWTLGGWRPDQLATAGEYKQRDRHQRIWTVLRRVSFSLARA
jgi:hypothetical protein